MAKELRVFLWVVMIGIVFIFILKYLFPLMAPFLLGLVFACLVEPLIKKIDICWKVGRKFAVILVLTILVISIFAITGLSLLTFYQEAQRLIPRIPGLVNSLFERIQEWLFHLEKYFPQLNEVVKDYLLPSQAIDHILRSLIIGVLNFLPRFPQILFAIGLGGFTAYFFSRDKKKISQRFYRILPKSWQRATVQLKMEMMTSVARFIRVECTLAFITTILTMAVFYFLGIPGALAYGFLTGILDFLPAIGPGLVYIPLTFIELLYKNFYQALWLLAGYFLVLMVRQVVEFKLIGENLNLHPLLSILVIYIGINVFGFMGIFFGPLLIITLRACYRVLIGLETS